MRELWANTIVGKSRKRSKTKKVLYRNFKAGSLTTDEHYLERAGLRGRKVALCYLLVVGMLLFSLGHLMVTCAVLGVLRFEADGFPFLRQESSSIVWPRGGNLSNVTIATPHNVSSFLNQSLTLSSIGQEKVAFESSNISGSSSFSTSNSSTQALIANSFQVTHPSPSRSPALYVNHTHMQVRELYVASHLTTTSITTQTLIDVARVQSSQRLVLRGAGGVAVTARDVAVTSGHLLSLNARGTLRINSDNGIRLNMTTPTSSGNYHICIRNGTLFIVPSNPLGCRRPDPN